jgi:AcrR family transcriptional regulator
MDDNRRPARGRILQTAGRLFYRDGYRAVGVDTIVAEAGATKMTLYRYFPSKDELIAAYLEESNAGFWRWFEEAAGSPDDLARDRLVALFTALEALATAPACLGCPFLNAVVDFPAPDHPGHRAALAHKQAMRARLLQLTQAAGAAQPQRLADHLLLLADGALMAARLFGPDNPAQGVAATAAMLIDAQIAAAAG